MGYQIGSREWEYQIIRDQFKGILEAFRFRPDQYIEHALGGVLWRTDRFDMRAIPCSVFANRITAVASCHGIGKSWIAARIAQAFFDTYPGSTVITTAPTFRQVRRVLWKEIPAANFAARKFFGWSDQPNQVEISRTPQWSMWGLAANQHNDSAFQGIHNQDILIIVDEAAGVSESIMAGVKACATGANARILMIGNPTNPTCRFRKAFDDPAVAKFRISAFDTPNFRAFGIEPQHIFDGSWRKMVGRSPMPFPSLVDPEWVASVWADSQDVDDPYWRCRVMARFPVEDSNQLIPLHWVEHAQSLGRASEWYLRDLEEREDPRKRSSIGSFDQTDGTRPTPDDVRRWGVDVAEMGGDESATYRKWGRQVRLLVSMRRAELPSYWNALGNKAAEETAAGREPNAINVDATGIGSGLHGRLTELGLPSRRMIMSASASDPIYTNLRSELFHLLRAYFDPSNPESLDLDPKDETLARQLVSIRAKVRDGKRGIVSKDEMRREAQKAGAEGRSRSPDRADAVMLSVAPTELGESTQRFGMFV